MALVFNPNGNIATNTGNGVASPITVTINAVTPGNTLYVALTWTDSAGALALASPAAPTGYITDASSATVGTSGEGVGLVVYRRSAAPGGTNAISIPISVGTSPYFWAITAFETTPSVLDKHPTPVSSATSSLTGPSTGTLTQPVEFAIALCGAASSVATGIPVLPAGFTSIFSNTLNGLAIQAAQQITSVTTALNPSWTSTNAISMVAIVLTFTEAVRGGILLGGRHPGRGVGRNSGRFQQFSLSTVNPSAASALSAFTTTVSPAFASLTGTGALAAFSADVSPAFAPLTGIGSLAALVTSVSPAFAGLTGPLPASAFTTSVSPAFASISGAGALSALTASVSPSFADLEALSSGAISAFSISVSPAFASLTATGILTSFTLDVSPAIAALSGIGALAASTLSVSPAFADLETLAAGSVSAFGIAVSPAFATISFTFTPPDIAPPPTGALLPGVKTAIELERGFKYPWQATGAPIVPSPFMGSSESLAPLAPIVAPTFHVEPAIAPTEDEALLLLLLLGASL